MGIQTQNNDITIDNQPITHDTYLEILSCFNKVNRKAYPIMPKQYIHYTSIQSFHVMLKPFAEEHKDFVILFASKVQFLNDSSEFKTGYDLIKNNYSVLAKKLSLAKGLQLRDDAFTVSFCGEEDLLSQWKYYGKDSGVAIEFDFDNMLSANFLWAKSSLEKKDEWNYEDDHAFRFTPSAVIYGKKRQEKAFKKMVSLIKDNNMGMYKNVIINSFIPFCKDISFFEEKESRLLFYPINDSGTLSRETTQIQYRGTKEKIIPQFECRLFYDNHGQSELKHPPIPIKNVMVGPGYNQTVVFNGVISMLEHGTCPIGYIDEEKIKAIKQKSKARVPYTNMQSIEANTLCVVTKEKSTKASGENKSIHDVLEYVTYKTSSGITVQLSATPFRS